MIYRYFAKRVFDLTFSLIAIVFLFIPIFLISLLLIIYNKDTKIFFTQNRTGKGAKKFKVIKFKTMSDKKDEYGKLLPDDERITKIGKFLRNTSLDELPQLFNVFIGDMSFVGPRPLLEKYIPLYSREQFRRHEVRPGITGWAQINGRNNISWTKKFELDIWYVDNLSFFLDLKILLLTVLKVIKRADITPNDPKKFEPFNGNN